MKFNDYKLNTLYPVESLKSFWYTKERYNVITFVKEKKFVIFIRNERIPSYFISKINYIRRAIIKSQIVHNVIDKFLEKNNFPFPELKKIIISFLGLNDTLYFYDNNDKEKRENNLNCGYDLKLYNSYYEKQR